MRLTRGLPWLLPLALVIVALSNGAALGGSQPDLTPANQSRSVAAGASTTFNLTLQNTGLLTDSYSLNVTAALGGWTATFAPTNVTNLGAGASTNVSLSVQVAASAPPGSSHTFTIRVRSNADASKNDSATATVNVAAPSTVDLEAASVTASPGAPAAGQSVTFQARVRNTGTGASGSFVVRFRLDNATTIGDVTQASVAAGAEVTVTSPSWTATAGTHFMAATADATDQVAESNESNNRATVTYSVASSPYGVSLTTPEAAQYGDPSQNVTYPLEVRNVGTQSDTISLTTSSATQPWARGLTATNVSLAGGASTTVTLWVRVPSDAAPRAQAGVTVTAQSQGDATRTTSLSTYTNVRDPASSPPPVTTSVTVVTTVVSTVVTGSTNASGETAASLPSVPRWVPFAMWGIGGLCLGAAVVANENTRFRLLLFALPLYNRLQREDLLSHEMRGRIHAHIRRAPGVHFGELKRALELQNGTLAHHLWMLERQRLISSERDGFRKRFYPEGPRVEVAMPLSTMQRSILDLISGRPGITQKELGTMLGISKQLANYHVQRLEQLGLVRAEQAGRISRCYLKNRAVPQRPLAD